MENKCPLPRGKSTRLNAINSFFDHYGAVYTVSMVSDQELLVTSWCSDILRITKLIKFPLNEISYQIYSNGIRLAIACPLDLIDCACDLLDLSWESLDNYYLKGEFYSDQQISDDRLMLSINQQAKPVLRKLYAITKERRLNLFFDENFAYIGSGKLQYKCELDSLDISTIPWDKISNIPAVAVTGTNGKTTTVRLTAFIARHSGLNVGYSSTDGIIVNDQMIEEGDLSGPYGAQQILINPNLDIAVLESARGGLSRRGIGASNLNGATITNISNDHLGLDGVDTLGDILKIKSLVYRTLSSKGYAVVNLDDEQIFNNRDDIDVENIIFISQNLHNHEISKIISNAQYACYYIDGDFYWKDPKQKVKITSAHLVPITSNGLAKHNIENILNAISLSYCLGISFAQISKALSVFGLDPKNNLGRANIFDINQGKIIVDFAHNVAGFNALINLARGLVKDRGRVILAFGLTGDRAYMIADVCKFIVDNKLDQIIVRDTEEYLRGANPGELPKAILEHLAKFGQNQNTVLSLKNEMETFDYTLQNIKPGDAVILCIQENMAEVVEKLQQIADLHAPYSV